MSPPSVLPDYQPELDCLECKQDNKVQFRIVDVNNQQNANNNKADEEWGKLRSTSIGKLQDRPTEAPLRRTVVTWIMYMGQSYYAYLQAVLGPIMPFLQEELNISYLQTGIYFSAFAFGILLCGSSADILTARLGRRTAFWIGGSVMALFACIFITFKTFGVTVASSFLMGYFGTFCLSISTAVLADRHLEHRSVVLSESLFFCCLAAFSAPTLVGLSASYLPWVGWRLAVWVPVVLFVCMAGAALHVDWDPPAAQSPTAGSLPSPPSAHADGNATVDAERVPLVEVGQGTGAGPKDVGESSVHVEAEAGGRAASGERLPGTFWAYTVIVFLSVAHEWILIYWGAIHMQTDLGLPKEKAATYGNLFLLAMTIGRQGGSRVVRSGTTRPLLVGALALNLAGFLLFWLATFSASVAVTGLFIAGLGMSVQYPFSVSLAFAATTPSMSDRASARMTLCGGVAILFGSQALGVLADLMPMMTAMVLPLLLIILALIICILFLFCYHPRTPVPASKSGYCLVPITPPLPSAPLSDDREDLVAAAHLPPISPSEEIPDI